jgi:predicted ATP-grasp superfamily ATP-dependent carboligase
MALWSRYATSTFLSLDAALNPHDFAKDLGEELRARYALCALVSSDDALWALSRYRDFLPASAQRLLAPHISIVRALDDEALYDFAKSVGIPCIGHKRIPSKCADLILSELKGFRFPLLLRPHISWIEREHGSSYINSYLIIKSIRQLKDIIKNSFNFAEKDILISPYEHKRALSYFGICDKGQVLVEGFQERLNKMLSIIEPIKVLRNYARDLLGALQWQGPFKVDFIKDQRGYYRLVSLTGRLWESTHLAVSTGCNIPLLCYHLAADSLNLKEPIKTHAKKNSQSYFNILDFEDPMPFLFGLQNSLFGRKNS